MEEAAKNDLPEVNRTEAYELWALCDYWPLRDAVCLLFSNKPVLPGQTHPKSSDPRMEVLYTVARNCAGASLPVIASTTDPGRVDVAPRDFLDWADRKRFVVSGELRMAVEDAGDGSATGRTKRPRQLTASQRHQQRCRSIAAYLWRDNPTETIADMAQRPELREFGCEGRRYEHATIKNWIKEEAPNRRPGRRPKASETPINF